MLHPQNTLNHEQTETKHQAVVQSRSATRKMMAKGSEALSDAELLGILIGSGNTEESAVELMRRILATCDNNLNELGNGKYGTFLHSKAWDRQKPHHHGALELGKRRKLQESKEREQIRCSEDIYKLFHPLIVICARRVLDSASDQACKVINKLRISTGGIDGTYADVRTILRKH